ncbi:MAG TPA: hypothetical protein VFQ05_05630 [Candidatus Eisenbacteria bacterium]|nr:hypothetical protein [Candidatus Eisenbacteria bacterium]
MSTSAKRTIGGLAALAVVMGVVVAGAQPAPILEPPDPSRPWLADRGSGVWTSIFGTYVRPRELLVSPFVEYYVDDDLEYEPFEFGHGLEQEFRGKYRATEGLIFLAYGFSDRLAIELEAAIITATLEKAPDDPSSMPEKIEESGQGDWQVELDWRMLHETATRPELFSFFELTPPANEDARLIGTPDWEYKAGFGLIKGLSWGTLIGRLALAYSAEEEALEAGEYAVEYLKRLNSHWRVYAGIEGEQDEVELISEVQWHFSPRGYLRVNSGYGLTSKATDWSPDVGLVFSFGGR